MTTDAPFLPPALHKIFAADSIKAFVLSLVDGSGGLIIKGNKSEL